MKRISSLRLGIATGVGVIMLLGRPLGLSIFTVWGMGAVLLAWGAAPFHRVSAQGMRERLIRSDMLVSLSACAAFVASTVAVFFTETLPEGLRGHHLGTLACVIVGALAGRWIEDRLTVGRDVLGKLLRRLPRSARVLRGGGEATVSSSEVAAGERVLVRSGEQIPFDGTILEGSSRVDESIWTGSDVPVEKRPGCRVYGGSQNKGGNLTVSVARVGKDMDLARLVDSVRDGMSLKDRGEDTADRLTRVYLPAVVIVSMTAGVLWSWKGPEPRLIGAFTGMIMVLTAACPWTLLLGAPAALAVAMRQGLRQGVRLRNPARLEGLRLPSVVVLNRKGVLTFGKPQVEEVILCSDLGEGEVLRWAAAAESRSDHFFARALRLKVHEPLPEPESVEVSPGQGVSADISGRRVLVGSLSWLAGQGITAGPGLLKRLESDTRSLSGVAIDGTMTGVILYSETYRESNREGVHRLERMGISVVLASGDREGAVRLAAEQAGIGRAHSEALEGDKLRVIRELKSSGNVVAMVGDSVHDVAALSRADLGVALAPLPPDIGQRGRRALGAGIDLAAESADIVLERRDLTSLTAGIRLAVQIRRAVRENLVWSMLIHAATLPLAGGILFYTTGMGIRFLHLATAAVTSAFLVTVCSWRRFTKV